MGRNTGPKERLSRRAGVELEFRRYVTQAQRATALATGDRLLQILELRLDNVVHRLGFASTRAQARQFVSHGHIDVNGRRCTIPSRRLAEGDIVSFTAESPARPVAHAAGELVDLVPAWLLTDSEPLIGRVVSLPVRAEIQVPLEEQMIVEYYSRV